MIAVDRADTPRVLQRLGARWTSALKSAKTEATKKRALGKYKHPEIKTALRGMFHDKCAYCESYLRHVSYGEIEHFRPKSRFSSFVFKWSNLFLACGICNGKEHKGDQFPKQIDGGPLVNPIDDDPAEHFSFEFDVKTKLTTVVPLTERGRTTERILGLNRADGLREHRSRQVTRARVLRLLAATDGEARELYEELQSRVKEGSEEYSAFLQAGGGAPG